MKNKPCRPNTDDCRQPTAHHGHVAALARQINANPDADPAALATAIERLILTEILTTLADPHALAEARLAAAQDYFKWRQGDLARQRLELEQAKLAAAQAKQAQQSAPPPDPISEAELAQTMDHLDKLLGLPPQPLPSRDPIPLPPSNNAAPRAVPPVVAASP